MSLSSPAGDIFYQIMDYRDTRAFILDPCIQEFFIKVVREKIQNCNSREISRSCMKYQYYIELFREINEPFSRFFSVI